MCQYELIERVLAQFGIDDGYAKVKWTPAEDGLGTSWQLRYSIVVVMMLYLSGQTSPDINYAVKFFARYMLCYWQFNELPLKRIGQYLKGKSTKGLIINLSSDLWKIYC